ncbi:MAG: hypothetical protein U1B83_07960, partial [Candidatus Cloacimonadaceae bacterium]|nr:hypothetical protein [Candidatus Cloacimonadaceae bacterium]
GLSEMFLENIRSSSARAHTDVSILAISKTDLWYLINNHHRLGAKVLIAISSFLSRYLVKVTSSQER